KGGDQMNEFMIWIWLGFFILATLFEIATLDFVSIWFALAAIPVVILAAVNVEPWIQILVFIVVSFVLLLLTRPVVMKYVRKNEIKTNVDSLIGTTAFAITRIVPNHIGKVMLNGIEWSAISKEIIEIDDQVRILDIEGVKLIVEKI
ncbi:MAG: NfeD family protein, partial [Acholeplasmataceae bacterium]